MRKHGSLNQFSPSYEQIDRFIEVLKTHPEIKGDMTLVGGEVFVDNDKLIYFLEKMKQVNQANNGNTAKDADKRNFKFGFITNMTIYEPRLKDYKDMIGNMQASIDGFETTHDMFRKFSDGTGSFETVIENYYKYSLDGFSINPHTVATLANIRMLPGSMKQFLRRVDLLDGLWDIQVDHYADWKRHPFLLLRLYSYALYLWLKYDKMIVNIPGASNPRSQEKTRSISVCRAGASFLGLDLVSGQIHGCHETCGTKMDIVGSLKDFSLDQTLLAKNEKDLDPSLYRIQYLPKWLSQKLLKYAGANICTFRSSQAGDKFSVPFSTFFPEILGTLFGDIFRFIQKIRHWDFVFSNDQTFACVKLKKRPVVYITKSKNGFVSQKIDPRTLLKKSSSVVEKLLKDNDLVKENLHDTIDSITEYIAKHITYKKDEAEFWTSFDATTFTGTANCGGVSVLVAQMLISSKLIKPEDVYVAHVSGRTGGHAFCILKVDNNFFRIDLLEKMPIRPLRNIIDGYLFNFIFSYKDTFGRAKEFMIDG
jgi:sulfatase maturation enzyme AslB (radical SAM superfamily)